MSLDYQTILTRANLLYAHAKTTHIDQDTLKYWAPEMFPAIESDQVKCVLKALIEELNGQNLEKNLIPPQDKPEINTRIEDRRPAGYF